MSITLNDVVTIPEATGAVIPTPVPATPTLSTAVDQNNPMIPTVVPCACGAPQPCYLRSAESQLPCVQLSYASTVTQHCNNCCCSPCNCSAAVHYGGAIRSIAELVARCAQESGVIVSTNACSAQEIAEARAERRLYVDPTGIGFVLQSRAWLDKLRQCRVC